jgi:hypothetical protein
MDSLDVVALQLWPAVLLVCASANMLISWTVSWSELIFSLAIGVIAGVSLFLGTRPDPSGVETCLFVFSHGFFGLLWATSDGFRGAFDDPEQLIWFMAGLRLGATVWCAAWDWLSDRIGAELGPRQILFSLVLFPVKWPFAFITGSVGFLIWIAGLIRAIASRGKASFAGGVFVAQFDPARHGEHSTTIGWAIHSWYGKTSFRHELYHTRQYIFMGDWLMPFWVLGCLWGAACAAIEQARGPAGTPFDTQLVIGGRKGELHLGNPLEIAAYQLDP